MEVKIYLKMGFSIVNCKYCKIYGVILYFSDRASSYNSGK